MNGFCGIAFWAFVSVGHRTDLSLHTVDIRLNRSAYLAVRRREKRAASAPRLGGGATVLDNTVNCTHCVEWHSFRVWGFEVKRPDGGKTGVKPR